MTETPRDYLLSNKTYDLLNAVVTLVLPAIGTLYFAIASIWGLPEPEKVVGTIAAVTTFLGVLLKIANKSYGASRDKYDGEVEVNSDGQFAGIAQHGLVTGDTGSDILLRAYKAEE